MSVVTDLTQRIRRHAAFVILPVCGLLLWFLIRRGSWALVGPVAGAVIGTILGIFTHKPREGQITGNTNLLDIRFPVIVGAAYVAVLIIQYRFVTYYRPMTHYALFGLYAGFIAYQISRGEPKQRILPQIIVLAFFTYWSTQFVFPAGMYGPDTHRAYVPGIQKILRIGHVTPDIFYSRTPGHLFYVAAFAAVSDLSVQISYYLLSVLVLVVTLPLMGLLDRVFPNISQKTVLFGTLIYACMSWTLSRGMNPNKINFMYPLMILILLIVIGFLSQKLVKYSQRNRFLVITAFAVAALITSHNFSSGATLIILGSLLVFLMLILPILRKEYQLTPDGRIKFLVLGIGAALAAYQLVIGSLFVRLAGLMASILSIAGGGGGGAGRYSTLPLDVLLFTTSGQAMLFALAVVGAVYALKRQRWDWDFLLWWLAVGAAFLLFGLFVNSADTQPQRIYSLLGLFGLNLLAGLTLRQISSSRNSINRDIAVGAIIVVFAILSMSSPVADMATSPAGDKVPHFRRYETFQHLNGEEWQNSHLTDGALTMSVPKSEVPIEQIGRRTGSVNTTSISCKQKYAYSELANETGILVDSGLQVGDRVFLFTNLKPSLAHDAIYRNGGTQVFRKDCYVGNT